MATKKKKKAVKLDLAEFFQDEDAQAELLSDAFASGDSSYMSHALGIVAKAKGMTKVAKAVGVSRVALYKSLDKGGDPKLSTFVGTIEALGYRLKLESA